jgi:hypothetical protein
VGRDVAITLLIGLPSTLDGLLRSVTRTDSNFARRFSADPGTHWSRPNGYRESVAEPLQALAADLRSVGGEVREEATLADIAAATRQSRVVVVMAHWKGAVFEPDDVLNADTATLAHLLAEEPDFHGDAATLRGVRPGDRHRIIECLNEAVAAHADRLLRRPDAGGLSVEMHRNTALSRARSALDSLLANAVVAGERLELFDGLHDVAAVERAVSPSFTGVLDLTTCTSMVLADQLDRARNGAFRTVQFGADLTPALAALALRRTLQRTKTLSPDDYLIGRRDAVFEVAQIVEREAASRLKWRIPSLRSLFSRRTLTQE